MSVGEINAVSLGNLDPAFDVFIADLITEAARTGMNHNADIALTQSHCPGVFSRVQNLTVIWFVPVNWRKRLLMDNQAPELTET